MKNNYFILLFSGAMGFDIWLELYQNDIFLVCGGPPCQAYLTDGKRLGTDDKHGQLYIPFIHAIEKIQPRFFVMKNEKGLLSITENNIFLLKSILDKFNKMVLHN